QAQDAATAKLDVELNALAPSQKVCIMTFVAENNLQAPINKISFQLRLWLWRGDLCWRFRLGRNRGRLERLDLFRFGLRRGCGEW
ncbi:hypothetical protein ACC687_40060, partial [Rhizobium ruizarguesonis]